MLDELRVIHGRLDEPVPVGEDGGTIRVELNHTDPDVAAVRLPARRQRHPDPRRRPQPRRRGPRRHAGLQGPADAGQGVGRRPGRRGVPRRAISDSDSGWTGMAELEVAAARPRRAVRRRRRSTCEPARDLPCHTGLVLLSDRGTRPRPGRSRQAGAPGPRRPRGVRHPRPLRRAADRAGDAARPRGRHRLPRRPGRHRQVGAGAVRRARGGDGAPPAQEGRGLPAAVRRRRPGARLPARVREREDVALGAGGLRHPRRDHLAAT